MMKVCIVWCEMPEDVTFVSLDVTFEQYQLLKSFNGHYINGTPPEINDLMCDFFYEEGKFKFETKKITGPIEATLFDMIVICGFIL